MTIRLSIISLAGMARTLVAVGTSNDADMFFTTAAAAPRSTRVSSPSADGPGRRPSAWRGGRVISAPWRQPCLSVGSWRAAPSSAPWPERAPAVRRCPRPVAHLHRCRRPVPESSRPRIHASWDRPRRDLRGTCDTSPRPTIRSARMAVVYCSRQLLASFLLPIDGSGSPELTQHNQLTD